MSNDHEPVNGSEAPASPFNSAVLSSLYVDSDQQVEPIEGVNLNGHIHTIFVRPPTAGQVEQYWDGMKEGAKPADKTKARARLVFQCLREQDGSVPTHDGRVVTIDTYTRLRPQALIALATAVMKAGGFGKEAEEDAGKG